MLLLVNDNSYLRSFLISLLIVICVRLSGMLNYMPYLFGGNLLYLIFFNYVVLTVHIFFVIVISEDWCSYFPHCS